MKKPWSDVTTVSFGSFLVMSSTMTKYLVVSFEALLAEAGEITLISKSLPELSNMVWNS